MYLRRSRDGSRLFVRKCAHKRIVINIMKVYLERNNIHVELIRFSKNIDFIDAGNFEVGNFRDRRVYENRLISIRDASPLFCAGQNASYFSGYAYV